MTAHDEAVPANPYLKNWKLITLIFIAIISLGLTVGWKTVQRVLNQLWTIECVDCRKDIRDLSDRTLRIDSGGNLHLAYGSSQLYYSWNDGTSWYTEIVDGLGWIRDPALSLDANGYPHISYSSYPTLKYAYQDLNGWHIEDVDTQGDGSSIALDNNGYPRISYSSSSELRYAYKDLSGWHTQALEILPYPFFVLDTSISFDSLTNYVHITYITGNCYIGCIDLHVKYIYQDTNGWHIEDLGLGSAATITLDFIGNPRIGFCNEDLYYAYKDLIGWQYEIVDSQCGSPSIVLDTSTYPHLSYIRLGELAYAYKDSSGWYTDTVDLATSGTSIALDGNGDPHISYLGSGEGDFMYAHRIASNWETEMLSKTGEPNPYPAPSADYNQNLSVSYYRRDKGTLYYADRTASGWQLEIVDNQAGSHIGSNSLVKDDSGNPHISYTSYGALHYAFKDISGWHFYNVASGGYYGQNSLAIDVSGHPHISYYETVGYMDSELNYSYQDITGWYSETVDTEWMAGFYNSIRSDANNFPHISYSSDGTLKYAFKDTNGWHIDIVDTSDAIYTSLALDSNDYPHISYVDATNEDLKYAYRDAAGWHIQTIDTDKVLGWTSLRLDQNGNVHISYRGNVYNVSYYNEEGTLRYAFQTVNGWNIVNVDDQGCDYGDNTLVLDDDDQPHIIYCPIEDFNILQAFDLTLVPPTNVIISGSPTGWVNGTYTFTATISPISTTLPINYLWQSTGQSTVSHSGGLTDTVSFSWTTPGVKDITVTASNIAGTVTDNYSIDIFDEPITGLSATNDSPTALGNPTTFAGSVTNGSNVFYSWDFGDGTTGIGASVTHTYQTAGVYQATVTASNSSGSQTASTNVLILNPQPNDPYYPNQWGLHRINIEQAWAHTQGAENVLIAVIDTGVDYNHVDLDDGKARTDIDFDYVNNDYDAMDDHGHGTHVAGIIAAETNNGECIASVCPFCQILPIKIADALGSFDVDDLSAAIRYATDQGADVINMSLGDFSCTTELADAVNYAYDNEVVLVAAAGNMHECPVEVALGLETSEISYPAVFDRVISVGATTQSDNRASISRYGPEMDISAPGVDIWSTALQDDYALGTGTSQASPFVAGTIGLLRTEQPSLTPAQIQDILQRSADDIESSGWDIYTGWGRLNAWGAMETPPISVNPAPEAICDNPSEQRSSSSKLQDLVTTYKQFRDEVLYNTPVGKDYIKLYNNYGIELAEILISNSDLRGRTAQFLEDAADEFASLLPDSTTELTLSQELYDEANALITDLSNAGDQEFALEMARVWDDLGLDEKIGEDTRQIWIELHDFNIYLPAIKK